MYVGIVYLYVYKLWVFVGNYVVVIYKVYGVWGVLGLDCFVGKGRVVYVGSVVYLLGVFYLFGVGGSIVLVFWWGSVLLEVLGIGFWGFVGGFVRVRYVVGVKILFLVSYY